MRISTVHRAAGRYDVSLQTRSEAVDFYRRAGDKEKYGLALANLAYLHQVMGERETARQSYESASAIFRELNKAADKFPLKYIAERLAKLNTPA
jgi:tetratricopeptide (TPR) repeat protein